MFFKKKPVYAPIAMFVYNRVDHPMQVIESLKKNPESKYTDLFVFSDGCKFADDNDKVNELRNFLKNITGFKSVKVFERKTNYGLGINLIDGITRVLETYDRVIVLEDDVVVNTNFLAFMNQCLTKYKDNSDIFTIQTTTGNPNAEADVICRKQPNCFGWAIWRDRWDLFERNVPMAFIEANDNNMQLRRKLNINDHINISWQLDANLNKKRFTWGVYLNYTSIKYGKLNIFPKYQLVTNIGEDGTGAHGNVKAMEQMNKDWDKTDFILPDKPEEQLLPDEPDKYVVEYNKTLVNDLKNAKYREFILSPALNKKIDEIREKCLFIPIGEYCLPRVLLTYADLKKRKKDGENTYPFDLAFTKDFDRLLSILKSKFDNFYDGLIYDESTSMWCDADKKYRFNYDLNKTFEQFKDIYDKRINNFLNDVQNTEKRLYFVYATDNKNLTQKNLDDLYMELIKYNHMAKLIIISHADNKNIKSDDNIKIIYEPFNLTKDWINELLITPHGRKFFENITGKIIDIVLN